MDREKKFKELRLFAEEIRVTALKEFLALGFGHVGGAMSVIEAISCLYGHYLRYDPKNPRWEDRDWVIMSKGHAGPSLYATLAMKGYFPMEELATLNKGGTNLPSHCDRNKTKGIDMTTGSLGQGISAAIGIAYGNRLAKRDSYTYLFIGDGECDEGQIWEGALLAPHLKLENLIVFLDHNKQQLDGFVEDVLPLGDLAGKWRSFDWNVQEINGHDIAQVFDAIANAQEHKGGPSIIVMHTIKGRGCTIAEGLESNHHLRFKQEDMIGAIEVAEKALAEARAAVEN